MNISKTSGYYRVTKRLWDNPSTSLCLFFWQFMWSLTLHIMLPVVVLATPVLCVLGHDPNSPIHCFIMFFGGLLWVLIIGLVILCAALFIIIGIPTLLVDMFWKEQYSNSVPIEYIKAKKRKICPIITFN